MFGREQEWEEILKVLDRAGNGQGGVLLVSGELGTGKSLLLARARKAGRRARLLGGSGSCEGAQASRSAAPGVEGVDLAAQVRGRAGPPSGRAVRRWSSVPIR